MSLWLVNASPLVFLGYLNRLELLREEGQEIVNAIPGKNAYAINRL
jgi:hypothetical protein